MNAREDDLEIPRRPRAWLQSAWAAAAVILAVVSLFAWDSANRLRRALHSNQKQIAQLEEQVAQERLWADAVSAPGARAAAFEPAPGAPPMLGRATFDPASRRAVVVLEEAHVPGDRDLELWALTPAGPRSLGLLEPDAAGRVAMRVEVPGELTLLAGFAVSLEPKGGSKDPHAPSGHVLMAAKLPG